jgi:hypothetical protein
MTNRFAGTDLTSEESAFCCGAELLIDGGLSLR